MRSAPKSIGVKQAVWPAEEDNVNMLFNDQLNVQESGRDKMLNQIRKRAVKEVLNSSPDESTNSSGSGNALPGQQRMQRVHASNIIEADIKNDSEMAPNKPLFSGQNGFAGLRGQKGDLADQMIGFSPQQNQEAGSNVDFNFGNYIGKVFNDENEEQNLESLRQFADVPVFKKEEKIDDQIQDVFVADWCGFCDNPISPTEQNEGNYTMLQSSNCFHNTHRKCLRDAILSKRAQDGHLSCPSCKAGIQDHELKQYVRDFEWKEVENYFTKQLIESCPNLFQCDCGNVIEFIEGQVDLGQKDEKGQLLTKEAAEHMAQHRLRCNQCQKNFCTKCRTQPYHLGKTCDQLNNVSCRFCLEELKEWNQNGGQAFVKVCKSQDCQKLISQSCDKVLECGHSCGGIRGEKQCLPCLEPDCIAKMDIHQAPNVDKDEFCSICYTTGLGQQPCVQLECGHIVHHECIVEQVSKGWNGARIVFNYLDCGQCKKEITGSYSDELNAALKPQLKFKQIVQEKAMKRAEYDNLGKDEKFLKPGNPYNGNLLTFAMNTLSYYQCFKCKDAYFVGRKDCAEGAQLDVNNLNKETLLCPKCAPKAAGGGITDCKVHGTDYIEFKCKFCCKRAVWFCWGNTHFCDPCHRKAYTIKNVPRDQLPKCKGQDCEIKMAHPEAGEEFALGCGMCGDKQANFKDLGF